MSDHDKQKIEQSERAWKIFDPEGYEAYKAKEAEMVASLFAQPPDAPICRECGGKMKVRDSMFHLVATAHCMSCGHIDYV